MPSGGQISLDEENGREREREKMQEGLTTNRARVIRKWRVVAHRRARK